jgi:hypothetical protein
MKRITLLFPLLLFFFTFVRSQELDCEITMKQEGLPSQAVDNIADFVNQAKQYINSYRWTNVDLGGERIKCRIDVMFTGSPRDNHYVVQAFIGSERPIFQSSGQSTAVLRLKDDKWEFDYNRGYSLVHNEANFDPLASFLDFYAYLILGFDFDSYKAGDGTPYFQKASDIVNRARGAGNAGPGWDITSDNLYTRAQFIDEIMNARLYDFRVAFYKYHYKGLDLLAKDDIRARKNILAALEKIGILQDKINTRTLLLKTFFETKYLEIAQTFSKDPDLTVFSRLSKIDPTHQQDYDRYRNGGQ